MNTRIEELGTTFTKETEAGKQRIAARFTADIDKARAEAAQSVSIERDEFETESEHRQKIEQIKQRRQEQVATLERRKQEELSDLDRRMKQEATIQTAGLRQNLKKISEQKFTIDPSALTFELGAYNPELKRFESTLKARDGVAVSLNLTAGIPLPRDRAKQFRDENAAKLIKPTVTVQAGSRKVIRVALTNHAVTSDSDDFLLILEDGQFISRGEQKRRQEEREKKAHEINERLAAIGIEMVPVPGGCFQMGDTYGDGHDDEKPVHEVCVSDFAIGKYEVTQGQWMKIMGSTPNNSNQCGDDCPVYMYEVMHAYNFIEKLNQLTGANFRFPTEAEWEYACRSGGKQEKYCGGNNVDAVAWYKDNSDNRLHPVGQKRANSLGIHDMSGNACEWVADTYYYTSGIFGHNYYADSPRNNPKSEYGGGHVLRGGGWNSGAHNVRATDRWSCSYRSLRVAYPAQ